MIKNLDLDTLFKVIIAIVYYQNELKKLFVYNI